MATEMVVMNEVRSRGLLQRALRVSRLAPWAAFVVACGGTSLVEAPADQGASAAGGQENHAAGAGGSAAASGAVGDAAGRASAGAGATAGAGAAGASGAAGNSSAGAGGGGGSGANGGAGGSSAGSGGDSGSAGMGFAGSSGNSGVCHARPAQPCLGGAITLPRSCVTEAMASAGTALPDATCRTMCEAIYASCKVSSVQQTSITVQCMTGCPTAQK